MIANKVMFIVMQNPNEYIKNNINPLNTTSNLSTSRGIKGNTHICFSYFLRYRLYYTFYKKTSEQNYFLKILMNTCKYIKMC